MGSMRRIIIVLVLLTVSLGAMSQRWEGFFQPKAGTTVDETLSREAGHQWYFRPTAQMTAIQFTYNREKKVFEAASFTSAGIGLGYQHYVQNDGEWLNNYGVNALIIFDASQNSQGGVGVALTANALQFVNLGAGYNLTDKQFFILTGAVWNF